MKLFQSLAAVLVCCFAATRGFADIPLVINHQGFVKVGGQAFDGTGYFKFGFHAGGVWKWTNDGSKLELTVGAEGSPTNKPSASVPIDVIDGNYAIRLGDTSLLNSDSSTMPALSSTVFNYSDVVLRVIFDPDGLGEAPEQVLAPDQKITSTAYAFAAARLKGPAGYAASAGVGAPVQVSIPTNQTYSSADLRLSLTTTGRPVLLLLAPKDTDNNNAQVSFSDAAGNFIGTVSFYRDNAVLAMQQVQISLAGSPSGVYGLPPSAFSFIDPVSPDDGLAHTYEVKFSCSAFTDEVILTRIKLVALEMR